MMSIIIGVDKGLIVVIANISVVISSVWILVMIDMVNVVNKVIASLILLILVIIVVNTDLLLFIFLLVVYPWCVYWCYY